MKQILKYKNLKVAFLNLLVILTLGCESFIEVELPDSQLTGDIVFNDLNSAESAMTSIYSQLSNNVLVCGNSKGLSILLGNYTDELQSYNTNIPEHLFFQNNLISTNATVSTVWNDSYNLIYAANAIIEGLENSTMISTSDKERLIGESLFIRAYIHFHLVNLFGEIPYVATTNYNTNASIGKLPISQIYTLMIDDLEQSKGLMPSNIQNQFKVRPNIATVKSLLARIHLFSQNWDSAETEASSVINSGNFVWVDELEDVFLKNSTGTIWQLMRNQEGLPTHDAQSFVFTMGPPPNRSLSSNLMNAFEPNDLRREYWVGNVNGTGETWHYPFKYKQSLVEGTSSEYSILFRLEELFLIRAESRIHLGDLEGAKNDINKIRTRASLSNTVAETVEQLTDAVIQERRVEFFSELGHRFFDLKRTNRLDSSLSPIKLGWNSTDSLWPIPDSELLLNPNLLPQNTGY